MIESTIFQGSYWDSNVGPNIVAAVVCAVPTISWGWIKLWPRWKKHEQKIQEIHEHLGLNTPTKWEHSVQDTAMKATIDVLNIQATNAPGHHDQQ